MLFLRVSWRPWRFTPLEFRSCRDLTAGDAWSAKGLQVVYDSPDSVFYFGNVEINQVSKSIIGEF